MTTMPLPLGGSEIVPVPLLTMPPEKVETPLTRMPVCAEIVPLLVMPPPKVETV